MISLVTHLRSFAFYCVPDSTRKQCETEIQCYPISEDAYLSVKYDLL